MANKESEKTETKKPAEKKAAKAPAKKAPAKKAAAPAKAKEEKFEVKKYEDDRIAFTSQRVSGSKIEIKATLKTPIVKLAQSRAINDIAQKVSIPGFRKGKAPKHVILQRFGSDVKSRAQDHLAQEGIAAVNKLEKIQLIRNAKIGSEVKSVTETEAELVFTYSTDPIITEVAPEKLNFKPVERKKLDKKELDEKRQKPLKMMAERKELDDVEMKEHHLVEVKVTNNLTGKEFFGFFELGKKKECVWPNVLLAPKWLTETLKAKKHKKDAPVIAEEVESTPEDDASEDAKKEFTPEKFRVEVVRVFELEVPELTDALVKEKFQIETVGEYNKAVQKILEDRIEKEAREEERTQISEQILEACPIDVPEELCHDEYRFRMQALQKDSRYMESISKMGQKEVEEEQNQLLGQCRKAIQMFYVTQDIVKRENVQIDAKSVMQQAQPTPLEFFLDPENAMVPQVQAAEAYSKALMDAAHDILIAKATGKAAPKKESAEKKTAPAKKQTAEKESVKDSAQKS